MTKHVLPTAIAAAILFWFSISTARSAEGGFFRDRVASILREHCIRCHQGPHPKGGIDLTSAQGLAAGAEHSPVIVAGKPGESRLIEVLLGDKPEMPKNGKPLSSAEIQVLRTWIAGGAPWPAALVLKEDPLDWWSLRPLIQRAIARAVPGPGWPRNPIDAFLIDKLAQTGLQPSSEADRRTLIRRLSFDLLGLPPEPAEVDAFLRDEHPLAYERLVDRLLASPHFGERWARHWLDVVHYGETHGYDKDKPRPNAWPYRDYLIRAFNSDRDYGRFIEEQIAGDVVEPDARDGIEATGFLAAGPWDFIGHAEVPETKIDGKIARNLDRDDIVTTTLDTFCSLTVQCARCHNHKFDPVTQEHYYSLQAVFAGIDRADRAYDIDPTVARRRCDLLKRKHQLDGGGPQEKSELAAVERALSQLPAQRRVYCGTVYSGSGAFRGTGGEGGRPRAIHVLQRGDVRQPGPLVGPGAVPIIKEVSWRFDGPSQNCEGNRRLALARWIADRRNPLTWRSIVNRVWLYHFGRGIVDSPNDFGRMGQRPTHPELLDWLAADLRNGDRSLKRLHRKIVTSAAYRQVSSSNHAGEFKDAANVLLWRMNRRRLDAESIRDSVLAASGRLQRRLYGPSFQAFAIEKPEHSPHYEYDKSDPNDPRTHRRSVYRFLVRSQQDPFMLTLDCADPSQITEKRDESTTALQALALLNNRFIVSMAERTAKRIESHPTDAAGQIDALWRLTLNRGPTAGESRMLEEFTRAYGLAETCRLAFNLNEFVFVD